MGELPSATYCVTGANGYIGSWLVKSLLQRGYMVHATVRDSARSDSLQSLGKPHEPRLRIFQADLLDEGSFDEAIDGCDGVFHVAAMMRFSTTEDGEDYVRSNIIEPAVQGTLNLLRSCLRSKKTVRRLVFTSSISTLTSTDNEGKWRPLVDESSQAPLHLVWEKKASGWVYVLSKILTEEAAFRFARANGIDMISVISPTIAGPFLGSAVPSSIQVLLSPITGDLELFKILSAVNSRMGSVSLAHIEDICNAHIFLMQKSEARGNYLCSAQSCKLSNLVEILARVYPTTRLLMEEKEIGPIPCEISSKKLKDLGFTFKFGVENIVRETVASCLSHGFLPLRPPST
ncbi:hypothetical protein SAY87_021667 [Trapa incisa]|uniref:NAD-dependent epimerase/dehydratase domain-containing protein n=1 Tax=Trapa incisa TaxID=236973 RepID=A0AAN7PRZ7_9MYRT|nr:hypothetical protein SAY87_021667 [Trapa incisa]